MAPPPPLMATPQMAFMEWSAPYEPSSPPHHHEGSPPTRHHSPSVGRGGSLLAAYAHRPVSRRASRGDSPPRADPNGPGGTVEYRRASWLPSPQGPGGEWAGGDCGTHDRGGAYANGHGDAPPGSTGRSTRVFGNTRRCSSMLTPRGSWTSGSTSCDASSRRSRHFRSRRPPRRRVDRLARILGHCDLMVSCTDGV